MPQGRTAFVTGATEGIGRAIAFALGQEGWRVGFCARTSEKVAAMEEALDAAGIEGLGTTADVGVEADVEAAVRLVEARLGPIDTLVNNAGVLVAKPFLELTLEEWDRTMATNVRSMFLVTRAVLPGMRARRRGDIVNVASLAGRNGFVGGTAYTASKHAVLGFSRSLMLETRKEGVRVIAVCPGSVATAMLQDQPMMKADMERIMQPEDVAAPVLAALQLPGRALLSELDVRPTNP
jgi:3-oxoacyl-[acyl-carrier protein] reductase